VKKLKYAVSAAILAASLPATAGEYAAFSPGLQVEAAQVSTKFVPFQSEAGNIQGAQVSTLLGFGLTGQIRLGPLVSESLSGLVLAPSAIYRFGKTTDNQVSSNLNFYTSNGSIVSVQDATSDRTTSTKVLGLTLPLRWYMSNSAVFGGLYFEGGAAWAREEQNVDLTVSGLIQAQQSQISEGAKITTTQSGYIIGVGYTWIHRENQTSLGLQYQSLNGVGALGTSGELRLALQWTF
jgi:hypothetical protein